MTLVLIEKGLVLEGSPWRIEVSWVLGIYRSKTEYCFSIRYGWSTKLAQHFQHVGMLLMEGHPSHHHDDVVFFFRLEGRFQQRGGKSEPFRNLQLGSPIFAPLLFVVEIVFFFLKGEPKNTFWFQRCFRFFSPFFFVGERIQMHFQGRKCSFQGGYYPDFPPTKTL